MPDQSAPTLEATAYSKLRQDPAKRISLVDASPLPHPLTIFVEPTNVCNFKCSYCPESFTDYGERAGGLFRLGVPDFERICDQILELGPLKTLNLYMMGEPFVNRNLPDLIAMAKDKGVADRVVVTSNGTLIDAAMAERVVASKLDYLRISIYGATQERMTSVTASKIPLDRVVANVRRVRELREQGGSKAPFVYVKMIDSGDPVENRRFLDLFAGSCDEATIEPVMNWNDPEGANLSGLGRDELLKSQYFSRRKEVCPFPFYTLVIHSDMKVSVCCVDWAKQTAVGNLKEQTVAEVWRGDALHEFRMTHLRRQRQTLEACRNCTYLHTAPDNLDALSSEAFAARRARPAGSSAHD
jgi:radical SAM protein with 4Fe4S-binding SPASM domain